MNNFNQIFNKLIFKHLKGCSKDDILEAEKELQLKFNDAYKSFLLQYGAVLYGNSEIFGLVSIPSLNVVYQTQLARKNYSTYNTPFPKDFYVIESMGIDGILLIQNQKGEVYIIGPHIKLQKEYNSFIEYLNAKNN